MRRAMNNGSVSASTLAAMLLSLTGAYLAVYPTVFPTGATDPNRQSKGTEGGSRQPSHTVDDAPDGVGGYTALFR